MPYTVDWDLTREWLQALTAPAVAVFVIYIAFQQYRVARDKLRLELFERRLTVYDAVIEFLGVAGAYGEPMSPHIAKLRENTKGSRFLFSKDVSDYLDALHTATRDIEHCNRHSEIAARGGTGDRDYFDAYESEMLGWIEAQYDVVDRLFAPYMRFSVKVGRKRPKLSAPPKFDKTR